MPLSRGRIFVTCWCNFAGMVVTDLLLEPYAMQVLELVLYLVVKYRQQHMLLQSLRHWCLHRMRRHT